jgi:hypothetical protein
MPIKSTGTGEGTGDPRTRGRGRLIKEIKARGKEKDTYCRRENNKGHKSVTKRV